MPIKNYKNIFMSTTVQKAKTKYKYYKYSKSVNEVLELCM